MDIGRADGCALLTSTQAVREAERNLSRKVPQAVNRLGHILASLEVLADAPPSDVVGWAESLGLPPKDAPILAAAIVTRADLLVTGDPRHFGPFFGRTLHGVRILSRAEGLAVALASAENEA